MYSYSNVFAIGGLFLTPGATFSLTHSLLINSGNGYLYFQPICLSHLRALGLWNDCYIISAKGTFFNMSDGPVAGICVISISSITFCCPCGHISNWCARLLTLHLCSLLWFYICGPWVFTLFLSWQGHFEYLLKQMSTSLLFGTERMCLRLEVLFVNPSHPCTYWLSLKHYDTGCSLRSRKGGHGLGRYHKRCLYTFLDKFLEDFYLKGTSYAYMYTYTHIHVKLPSGMVK